MHIIKEGKKCDVCTKVFCSKLIRPLIFSHERNICALFGFQYFLEFLSANLIFCKLDDIVFIWMNFKLFIREKQCLFILGRSYLNLVTIYLFEGDGGQDVLITPGLNVCWGPLYA